MSPDPAETSYLDCILLVLSSHCALVSQLTSGAATAHYRTHKGLTALCSLLQA